MTSSAADPFKPRPGHALAFSGVSLTAKRDKKEILKDVSGSIKPQQVCCILGPSGAGKSSLLHILAGRTVDGKEHSLERRITIDGTDIDPTKVQHKIAYVEQSDARLVHTSTPREAISFAARLKLPKSVDDQAVSDLTERILDELSLKGVADTIMGSGRDDSKGGLSGGELRRVSLGIALVVRPSLLLLDEVTSGLDSYSALQVMEVVQKVARSGAAVVMVAHQPSSQMFNMVDHAIFMAQGQILYEGSPKDVDQYFTDRGHPVPTDCNPADWVIQLAQTVDKTELELGSTAPLEDVDASGRSTDEEQPPSSSIKGDSRRSILMRSSAIARRSSTMARSQLTSMMSVMGNSNNSRRLSIYDTLSSPERIPVLQQTKLLIQREYRRLSRDSKQLRIRIATILAGAVTFSIILMGTGNGDFSNPTELQTIATALFFTSYALSVVIDFSLIDTENQYPLFHQEYRDDYFSLRSYMMMKVPYELIVGAIYSLPMTLLIYFAVDFSGSLFIYTSVLYVYVEVSIAVGMFFGCMLSNPKFAKEIAPAVILPQALLSGFFELPSWLEWAQYANPYTYVYRILLATEFSDCLEFTAEEEHAFYCAMNLQEVYQDADAALYGNPQAVGDDARLNLWFTGNYTGYEGIDEYIHIFSMDSSDPSSLLWDECAVDSKRQLVYHPTDDGSCDLTYTRVSRGRFNSRVVKDEHMDESWIMYNFGTRVKFNNTDFESGTLASTKLELIDVYMPVGFTDGVDATTDKDKLSDVICETMQDYCPSTFEANNFTSKEQCLDAFSVLPKSAVSERGDIVYDSNTTGCRYYHAIMAQDRPEQHCEHISFMPMEDINGKIKCTGDGNHASPHDFFDDKDFAAFSEVSVSANLDGFNHTAILLSKDEVPDCAAESGAFDFAAFQEIPEMPDTLACAAFLNDQRATGSENSQYWLALFGMYAGIRLAGFALLKLRSKMGRA